MKKFLWLFPLWFLLFLTLSVSNVSAHILKSDGSIGAVVHITPDDDPIIGQVAEFYFEFKDKLGKFTPKDCLCRIVIAENGQEIYSQDLVDASNKNQTTLGFTYTFQEKGVYQIKVSGNSVNAVSFSPFNLSYLIRVSRENPQKPASNFLLNNIHFFIIAGIVAVFLGMIVLQNQNKPNTKK